ncbi:MAG TPA: signal peptidase II [Vicinamibacteria bacterium]|nr:signal peptidase II [Vicinamibacteria bacterium]
MKPFVLPLSIVVLDQITKFLVIQKLPLYEDVPLISGLLSLQHVRNSGAVFGFLSGAQIPGKPYVFALMSAIALGALTYYARTIPREERLPRFALSLVIGGAIGNLIDRVRFGYVVDFVKMYWETHVWPNYNVADSAISIGLVLLVIDSFRPRDRETAAKASSVPSS